MVEVGPFTAGEFADLLKVTQAGIGQSEIGKAHWKSELLEQGQQLAMSLFCQAVTTQTFF